MQETKKHIDPKDFKSKSATEQKRLTFTTPVEKETPKPAYYTPSKMEIVPFYGSDNNFPSFLYDVGLLSPTIQAARKWKSAYTFGDGLKINGGEPLDMFAELSQEQKTTVTPAQEQAIINFVKAKNGNDENLIEFIKRIMAERLDVGNIVVVMHKFRAGNEDRFNYWSESMKHTRLIMEKQGVPSKWVAIDPNFENGLGYADSRTSKVYPLYPNFDNEGYSVLFVKNLIGGRMDYGLPVSFPSIHHQIGEASVPKFVNQLVDNRFISAGFIEVVDSYGMSQKEVDGVHKNLTSRWTNRTEKEKEPFGLRTVASKEDFSKVHEFNNNVDTEFLKETSSENSQKIISSELWHPLFMGVVNDRNLGGYKDEIQQVYLQLKGAVIQPLRNVVMGVVNTLLKEAGFTDVYLTLEDYKALKDMEKMAAETENQQPANE